MIMNNKYKRSLVVAAALLAIFFLSSCKRNSGIGDISVTEWLIPVSEVFDGGPGKDGIPALMDPPFIGVNAAFYLNAGDLVIGVKIGGVMVAFPHRVLDRHEIANILNGAIPYVLSYCPLTGTAMVWETRGGAADKSFGVSGLLYNSNLILYDRETDSNWSQMLMQCINGPLMRERPNVIHVIETTWQTWRQMFPNSMVLSSQTGFSSGLYDVYPYGDYKTSNDLIFPVNQDDSRLHRKERVHGVVVGDSTKAYVIRSFAGSVQSLNDTINGEPVVAVGNAESNFVVSFMRTLPDGTELTFTPVQNALPVVLEDNEGTRWDIFGMGVSGPRAGSQLTPTLSYNAYWFAWATFYPDAEIHE
ncbi:MAG: DUF3179 domain-containing protein [bacterium]|nr:DUF3179 domain-containing protein [bacterium]